MYELTVALKYLLPRRRQLSVSLISVVATLIISLVIWVVLVFLSVSRGLEANWIQKLVALSSPIRLTPKQAYFDSYYYQVDRFSQESDFHPKSIKQKLLTGDEDPYDIDSDIELPSYIQKPEKWRNIIAETFDVFSQTPLKASDYEIALSTLKLNHQSAEMFFPQEQRRGTINQYIYTDSFDAKNPFLDMMVPSFQSRDYHDLLTSLIYYQDRYSFESGLGAFFKKYQIDELQTDSAGWQVPLEIFEKKDQAIFSYGIFSKGRLNHIIVPSKKSSKNFLHLYETNPNYQCISGYIQYEEGLHWVDEKQENFRHLSSEDIIYLEGNQSFQVKGVASDLESIYFPSQLLFEVQFTIQGFQFDLTVPFRELTISKVSLQPGAEECSNSIWFDTYTNKTCSKLPYTDAGHGVLLPHFFREKGVHLADIGELEYQAVTPSGVQNQSIPIYVAGFYDPGIVPISVVLAEQSLVHTVRSAINALEDPQGNGIRLWTQDFHAIKDIKKEVEEKLLQKDLLQYWNVETFEEYEFSRDIIQELYSQRNLFQLLALIIILVACSNIISMLVLLVNDKKLEIAIFQAIGASRLQVASIFGFCGLAIGVSSFILGSVSAYFTLRYIKPLVDMISKFQGHELLNPQFYGDTLPSHIHQDVFLFAFVTTLCLSIVAAIIPALRASFLKPAQILKQ